MILRFQHGLNVVFVPTHLFYVLRYRIIPIYLYCFNYIVIILYKKPKMIDYTIILKVPIIDRYL